MPPGLQAFLLKPQTIAYLTDALSARLNALIDERPRLRDLRLAERDTIARKLAHLVSAVEDWRCDLDTPRRDTKP